MGEYMERLIVNRRSCRRYLDQNVEPWVVSKILNAMAAAPTGGNACNVEYTVIDDKIGSRTFGKLPTRHNGEAKSKNTCILTVSTTFIMEK